MLKTKRKGEFTDDTSFNMLRRRFFQQFYGQKSKQGNY